MVRRNRAFIILCIAAAVMLSVRAYGGKCGKKNALPAAVEASVKALFPNAAVDESKMEKDSVTAYEVEVEDGNNEYDVTVAEDGTVMEVSNEETMDTLPAAVVQTIEAQNAEVKEVEKEVEYAVLKVVKLDIPKTTYEVKIIKDGEEIELDIAADGTILGQETEEKKCHKDKDDDEEMDD